MHALKFFWYLLHTTRNLDNNFRKMSGAVFVFLSELPSKPLPSSFPSMLDLPQILLSIPDSKVSRMQRRLARVWQRFAWSSGTFLSGLHARTHEKVLSDTAGQPSAMTRGEGVRAVRKPWPVEEDAFHTIMSWLYSRIPFTR